MPAALFNQTFFYMLGGLVIWSVRFLVAYSFTAIACSRGWWDASVAGFGLIPFTNLALTLVGVAGCLALLAYAVPRLRFRAPDPAAEENTRFVHQIAATVALLAALSMLWETVPIFLVPVCR